MALLSLTAVGALNTSRVMYVAESRPYARHGGGPQAEAGKGSIPRTAAGPYYPGLWVAGGMFWLRRNRLVGS